MDERLNDERLNDDRLSQVKANLKAGRLEREDISVLEAIVERTELAARQLRAAIVE
jgi:hypothetical protein